MKHSKSFICTRWLMVLSVIGLSLLYAFDLHPARPVLAAESGHDTPGGLADGRFGINNVNRAWVVAEQVILSERRVEQALAVGARWNRVNVWWYDVEPYRTGCPAYPDYPDEPLDFIWNDYDSMMSLTQDMNTLFVLQGVPECWRKWSDGVPQKDAPQVPAHLDEPIFEHPGGETSDNIDGAIGINPHNPWANYVYQVVTHLGARYLQVWNEPTTSAEGGEDTFWLGTLPEFRRLVEITYFAAQYASQGEHVYLVMPGQSDPSPLDPGLHHAIRELLDELARKKSPLTGEPYLNCFDAYATHDYNQPWRTVEYPSVVQDYLAQYEEVNQAPFWITEFGANDHFYENPASDGIEGPEELKRASEIVQSIAYLLAVREEHNIERFFQVQLDNTNQCGLLKGPVDFHGQHGDQYERQAYAALLEFNAHLAHATPAAKDYEDGAAPRVLYDETPGTPGDHQEVNFISPDYDLITVLWSMQQGPDDVPIDVAAEDPNLPALLVWQDGETERLRAKKACYNPFRVLESSSLPSSCPSVRRGDGSHAEEGFPQYPRARTPTAHLLWAVRRCSPVERSLVHQPVRLG